MDLEGFTALSSARPPREVVRLLGAIFTEIDRAARAATEARRRPRPAPQPP